MDLLNKLTIKNLKLNKKRTIVTIIGIILSVALVTDVATMYLSGMKSLINFEKYIKGDFHVAFCDVPENEINTLKNNRNIEDTYIVKNVGYAKLEGLKNENKPYVYVKELTKSALENLSIRITEGRLPENENEILIPTHLKNNGRIELNIGDEITLNIGKRISNGKELNQSNSYNENEEEIIDITPKTYKIVGIIERPANTVEPYSAPGYTFISYMDENNISGKVDIYAKYTKEGIKNNERVTANILGIDENIFAKFSSGKDINENDIDKITNEIKKAKYEIIENNYLINLEKNPFSQDSGNGLGVVAGIICIIIVITSVFCIRNSFDISITEKIKQYGMLRSIGATKKQIKRNVLYEAMILGAIGIPIGIVCGNLASYILVIVSNYLLSEALTDGLKLYFSISWLAIIIAIILGTITIYLSAIGSAKKAAKISPIEAIKNSANIKIKAKNIKKSRIINKIFGIGGTISYKNLKRSKKKYRTTIVSIIVSVAVFIAVSSFIQLAFLDLNNTFVKSNYNLSLGININKNEKLYKKVTETTQLDGIENFTIKKETKMNIYNPKYNAEYSSYLGENEKSSINIIAIGTEQYKKYTKSLGLNYEKVKDKGILLDYLKTEQYEKNKVTTKYQREFSYNENEKIKGELLTKEQTETEIEIAKVAKEGPFGLEKYYGSSIIVSDEWYDTHIKEEDYFVEVLYKAENADKLQSEIDEILKGENKGENYSFYNRDENYRAMENLFTLIGVFLYGFIIVISLIGITNIFNTITTNMELRKQEFAMLKSIGMTKKEFKKMISLESIFIGIKSLIFGIPIGIGLSYALYHYIVAGYGGFAYPIPVVPIIISIIVVFLLITCIMKYSINKINKQNTIETIRNENI